jgi:hypothetical protein
MLLSASGEAGKLARKTQVVDPSTGHATTRFVGLGKVLVPLYPPGLHPSAKPSSKTLPRLKKPKEYLKFRPCTPGVPPQKLFQHRLQPNPYNRYFVYPESQVQGRHKFASISITNL